MVKTEKDKINWEKIHQEIKILTIITWLIGIGVIIGRYF